VQSLVDRNRWQDITGRFTRKPEVCPKKDTKDPIAFARSLDFHPDPVQEKVLLSKAAQIILLMGRQTGKSTVAALRAVWLAITKPGSQIITAGRVGRQSCELIGKVKAFLYRLNIQFHSDGHNAHSIVLKNGSRFVPSPGEHENIRGFSAIDLLIIDGAAYASDELYLALRPMLAVTNGSLILLSTPNGRRGFFSREWSSGSPDWDRFLHRTSECPRVSAEFLEREKSSQPDFYFRQEYDCDFTDPAGSLFSAARLESIFDKGISAKDL